MVTCPTCGTKKPSNDYTQVNFTLTNGSQMPVAVCLGCMDKVFHADKKQIMRAVREGWHREHEQMQWSKDQREHYWQTHGEGVLEIADA